MYAGAINNRQQQKGFGGITEPIPITRELLVTEGEWAAFKHEVPLRVFLCTPELLAEALVGLNEGTKGMVWKGPGGWAGTAVRGEEEKLRMWHSRDFTACVLSEAFLSCCGWFWKGVGFAHSTSSPEWPRAGQCHFPTFVWRWNPLTAQFSPWTRFWKCS